MFKVSGLVLLAAAAGLFTVGSASGAVIYVGSTGGHSYYMDDNYSTPGSMAPVATAFANGGSPSGIVTTGYLASLETIAETTAAQALMTAFTGGGNANGYSLWIGLSDSTPGTFVWASGNAYNAGDTLWAAGQPDTSKVYALWNKNWWENFTGISTATPSYPGDGFKRALYEMETPANMTVAVPEPTIFGLIGASAAGLLFRRRASKA